MSSRSMTIPDFQTTYMGKNGTPQTLTGDAVSEDVNEFDHGPGMIGLKGMILECRVGTAFTGMASGAALELRVATAADLTTNAVIIAAITGLTAALLSAGAVHVIGIPAYLRAVNVDFIGLYWNVVSESATAGTLFAGIKQGGEGVVV